MPRGVTVVYQNNREKIVNPVHLTKGIRQHHGSGLYHGRQNLCHGQVVYQTHAQQTDAFCATCDLWNCPGQIDRAAYCASELIALSE